MAIEKQILLDSFDKNSREVIKLHLQELGENRYLDLRVWLLDEPGTNGAEQSTERGLTLHVELLPRLIEALQRADELLRQSKEKADQQPAVCQVGRSQLGRSRLGGGA